MRAEVDVLEPLGAEVRVDLRRGDVRVAEHLLDRAQVAAAREEVRGEGVAQRVRAHPVLEPDGARMALDDLVEALPREAGATAVDEQMPRVGGGGQLRAAALEVEAHGGDGLAPDRDEALLGALAAGAQHAGLQVEVTDLEVDRLARAQPTRVHELEQRAVAQ